MPPRCASPGCATWPERRTTAKPTFTTCSLPERSSRREPEQGGETMATTVDHLPALPQHGRAQVGRELQATLLELIDLSLVGKQFHWALRGPGFTPLHLQLDELIDSW